jgi:hypothetical protein
MTTIIEPTRRNQSSANEWGPRAPSLNAFVRNGLEDLDPETPIAFFCECDRRCDRPVWLTQAGYERLRAGSNPRVLRPGHARAEPVEFATALPAHRTHDDLAATGRGAVRASARA